MDQQSLRTLRLLEEIEKDQTQSQRDLSQKLNISLGLVNSFIKRLAKKGYFKITTIPKNRVKYIITPKGFAEKTRLTYEYIQISFNLYRDVRRKFREMFHDFQEKKYKRVAFYGISDLTEIAYLSLQETDIKLVAIIDDRRHKEKRVLNTPIIVPEGAEKIAVDKIIITSTDKYQDIVGRLRKLGIPDKSIASL